MAAARQRIDDEQAPAARTAFGRLALSKQEAADALGVSVDPSGAGCASSAAGAAG